MLQMNCENASAGTWRSQRGSRVDPISEDGGRLEVRFHTASMDGLREACLSGCPHVFMQDVTQG